MGSVLSNAVLAGVSGSDAGGIPAYAGMTWEGAGMTVGTNDGRGWEWE